MKTKLVLVILTSIFTLTLCGTVFAENPQDTQSDQYSTNNLGDDISNPPATTTQTQQTNSISLPDPKNTRTGTSYVTIQEAINAADPGDEITVEPGTYNENVYINKENITLTSQGAVIIQTADPNKNAVSITANGAKISGFTITGASGHYHDSTKNLEIGYSGIHIEANNCSITNNELKGNAIGIGLSGASYNLLEKNIITDNPMCGIMVEDLSYNNKIYNNTVDNNGYGYPGVGVFEGVLIRDSASNEFIDNSLTNSGGAGIQILGSDKNIISGNTITDNGFGMIIFHTGGIDVQFSNKNNITGNSIKNNRDFGINAEVVSETIISGNTISDNGQSGIYFSNISPYITTNNQVLNNIISNAGQGIKIQDSVDTIITGNDVTGCTSWGIYLDGSTGDKLTSNTVKNSKIGIEILNALNTQLRNNIMENNEYNFGVNAGAAFGLPNYRTLDIDQSNTVNGKPIYYIVGQNGGTFDSSMNIGYLALISCQNIQVNSLQLSNNLQGVLLAGTNNTNVQNCEFSGNDAGISLKVNATGNVISGNEFTDDHITLESSSNNQITNNIITRTSGIPNSIGISIASASNNQITGNTISNTNYGVYLSFNSCNNLLNLNVITDNIVGIYLWGWKNLAQPTKNRIIQNTITGNQVGINTTPSDNEAHFNLISGNSLFGIINTNSSSFNATNNYWGSIDDPNNLISGPVVTSPYMVLRISASPTLIPLNDQSTITADLRYDSNGNYHDPTTEHIPDGTLIEFSTDLGSLETPGTKSVQKPTVNAISTTTLLAEGAAGEANITGKIGTDTKQTTVNIQPSADVYVNVNVDKVNPKIGDTVQLTFKVGNNNNKTAEGTILTLVIPYGLEFLSASSPDGYNNFSYDNKTRTLTWNLGDLPQIDPTIIVLITVTDPGTYTIRPLMSTITFDPNLEVMTGSTIIYAQSRLVATPNSDPNASTTVNAASNNVPMQNTGLPMGTAIIAALMIAGGLFNSRREK